MKKYRQLFYKSSLNGKVVDNAISMWTWIFNMGTKNYSHTERWYPDENGNFYTIEEGIVGECQSSTMGQIRDKNAQAVNGVVRRPAKDVLTNFKNWDWCEVTVEDEDFAFAEKWAQFRLKNNLGYGKKDIARFFMPAWLQKSLDLVDERWICSEENCQFAIDCGVLKGNPLVSPRRLSSKYKKVVSQILPLEYYL